jgi:L-lactate dehydrogenase complex protein LldG
MSARDEVLSKIRRALADVPDTERPDDVAVDRGYRHAGYTAGVLERFAAAVRDYRAEVRVVDRQEVAATVASACPAGRILVPPDLPPEWRPEGALEDDGRPGRELDEFEGVVTGCAVAIAQTGTIVLDGGALSGRRAITLVPDHHICVVRADQVVDLVPEALARIEDPTRPITFISGPSASSDIELQRVEGVHGPRRLVVVVARGSGQAGADPSVERL